MLIFLNLLSFVHITKPCFRLDLIPPDPLPTFPLNPFLTKALQ